MRNIQKKIVSLKQELNTSERQQMALLENSGEYLSDSDQATYDALDSQSKTLQGRISELETAAQNGQDLRDDLTTFARTIPAGSLGSIPAQPKNRNTVKCFSSPQKARKFGLWMMANVLGNKNAQSIIDRENIQFGASMGEDNNVTGGYLVPSEMASDMIRLVDERGVFRRESRVVELSSNALDIPRRTGGTTTYFVGEANAITDSDMSLDLVTLTLKKIAALTAVSSELASDAVISVFDMLGQDIAYGIADKEDECGFNGTGTSTYGGIVGVRQQMIEKALGGDETDTVPAASGLVRYATGFAYSNIAMEHLTAMIGKLPDYADANAKWYGSKLLWSYLLDLMADAGGNTVATLGEGPKGRNFLGYPFVTTSVMPKAAATNQVCLLLGDLQQATTTGLSKSGLRIETSNSAYVGSTSCFESDLTAIRGIERFDINVHDVGSTTAAGPVVGLISHTA